MCHSALYMSIQVENLYWKEVRKGSESLQYNFNGLGVRQFFLVNQFGRVTPSSICRRGERTPVVVSRVCQNVSFSFYVIWQWVLNRSKLKVSCLLQMYKLLPIPTVSNWYNISLLERGGETDIILLWSLLNFIMK